MMRAVALARGASIRPQKRAMWRVELIAASSRPFPNSSRLTEKGRWSTQGILFESGKSELKPESTPTLKSIAAALKAHPDLKVEIQGHTDNVGSAEMNLTLSQRRAEAVTAALTSDYGVSLAQITAKGYGDTKPVAKNATPEGRANNRRVEIVKL